MKKICFASVALLLGIVLHVSGQEESQKMQLNDISLSFSLHAAQPPQLLLSDLRQIAPHSDILSKDLSSYSYSNNNRYTGPTSKFSISSGYTIKNNNTRKGQIQMRVGFSWISNINSKTTLSKQETVRFDTLVSLQTGNYTFVDSVYFKNYFISHSYDRLQIEASLIYRTNQLLRWSLYSGIGMSAGGSLKNHLIIEQSDYTNFSRNETDLTYESILFPNMREIHKTKRVFGGTIFIPIGVDFRIAKNQELLSKMHLFYEAAPGVAITYIPDVAVYTGAAISFGTQIFGLRMVL